LGLEKFIRVGLELEVLLLADREGLGEGFAVGGGRGGGFFLCEGESRNGEGEQESLKGTEIF